MPTNSRIDTALFENLIVFAVAQEPFDHCPAGSRVTSTFCTLQPLVMEDGSRARATDFPNNGLVWWKLRAASMAHAQPGRLLAGFVEPAVVYSETDYSKQLYQAVAHEMAPADLEDIVEVYSVPDDAVEQARELVNTPGVIELDHPPAAQVLVRWRGELYGPLRTAIAASGEGLYRVSLSPPASDGGVHRMPDVPAGSAGVVHARGVAISADSQPPFRSTHVRQSNYELLLPEVYQHLRAHAFEQVPLLKDDDLILSAARRLMTRAERQRLSDLLNRLGAELTSDTREADVPAAELIATVRRRAELGSGAVAELARALLESDAMREPLARAVAERAQRHVEQSAATLATEIESRIGAERERLEALRHEREDLETDLALRRREAERSLQAAMDSAWREHRARVESDLAQVGEERERLERQAEELSNRLGAIASRFGAEHERIVGDLLVLLPILQRAGVGASPAPRAPGEPAEATSGEAAGRETERAREPSAPEWPVWVSTGAGDPRGAPSEPSFFERFASHAARVGPEYSEIELAAFHVAVKCGDLTLVGGPPGTGRTALVRVYTEALAGDAREGKDRLLVTSVQATWLDIEDLIGSVNPQARSFDPARSGIFEWLVRAAEEYARHGAESGLHLLCLAELDRATPTHYLGALLQSLDAPPGDRFLRCFDAAAVRPDSPFSRSSRVPLPPTLRLVGTLAEDASARPVAGAIRDRATEVRLAGAAARDAALGAATDRDVSGAPVPLRALQRWVREASLPAPWGELLDRLRDPIGAVGADLSPRAFRSLARFVASGGDVLPADAAFDVQLAWRVLPRFEAAAALAADAPVGAVATTLEPHLDRLPLTAGVLDGLRERISGPRLA